MRVFVVQTNPQEDKTKNVAQAFSLVRIAAQQGAEIVVLPEMFSFMGADADRFQNADFLGQGVFAELADLAKTCGIYLVGGSHGERPVQGSEAQLASRKIHNTSQTFSPAGEVVATYRKVHLFNLRSRSGQSEFKEADHYLAGQPPQSTFELKGKGQVWQALTLICYDLRFPEIFRQETMLQKPPDVVFLPAAFTYRTGLAHWEVLLRARAIENHCYIVACNQTGFFAGGQKRNFGHSLVVSPWGEIKLNACEDVGTWGCEIDLQEVAAARAQIPALENRVVGIGKRN